jgi:hypothetical protein
LKWTCRIEHETRQLHTSRIVGLIVRFDEIALLGFVLSIHSCCSTINVAPYCVILTSDVDISLNCRRHNSHPTFSSPNLWRSFLKTERVQVERAVFYDFSSAFCDAYICGVPTVFRLLRSFVRVEWHSIFVIHDRMDDMIYHSEGRRFL